jgi:uncharacterized protein (UPF0212 family)
MAKLIKCITCSAEIAKNAKVCPHCGAKIKRTSTFTWLVLIFILIAIGNAIFNPESLERAEQRIAERNEASAVGQVEKPNPKATDAMKAQREKVQALFQGNEEPTAKDAL